MFVCAMRNSRFWKPEATAPLCDPVFGTVVFHVEITDHFGLSATRIMDYLLSGEPFDKEKCCSLIDRRVKASKDEVMDAVHGYHILEEQNSR